MKCISLTEPWATLVSLDEKRFETRGASFPKVHRGDLAIASSKSFPGDCRALCYKNDPFTSVLYRHGITKLRPMVEGLGSILCVVEVVGYARAEDIAPPSPHPGCRSWTSRDGSILVRPGEHEHAFGDYSPGRTIILTRNVRRLRAPVPVVRWEKGAARPGGALGVYELAPACEAAVRAQLEVTRG